MLWLGPDPEEPLAQTIKSLLGREVFRYQSFRKDLDLGGAHGLPSSPGRGARLPSDQLRVGEPLPDHARHCDDEPVLIFALPVVEAERLFIKVAE